MSPTVCVHERGSPVHVPHGTEGSGMTRSVVSITTVRPQSRMRQTRVPRTPRSRSTTAPPVSLARWREYHDELFPLGVTPGQARILLYIQQHPRCYLQQCARALGLSSRTVGYPVQMFQQKRWVSKRRAPQDDRYVSLTLTRHGQALARKIHQRLDDRFTSCPSTARGTP
jgi:DNA-binding MarR family transcriptional regulator